MFSVEKIVSNDKVFCGDCVIKAAEYVFTFMSETNAPLYLGGSSIYLCKDCFNKLKKAVNSIKGGE